MNNSTCGYAIRRESTRRAPRFCSSVVFQGGWFLVWNCPIKQTNPSMICTVWTKAFLDVKLLFLKVSKAKRTIQTKFQPSKHAVKNQTSSCKFHRFPANPPQTQKNRGILVISYPAVNPKEKRCRNQWAVNLTGQQVLKSSQELLAKKHQ